MRYYRATSTSSKARAGAVARGHWVARVGLALLVMASLALVWLSKNDSRIVSNVRTTITDGLVPLVSALSAPAEFAQKANARLDAYLTVYNENERLRSENARLVQWQNLATQLQAENESLRQLSGLKEAPALSYVTARVVGSGGHLYNNVVTLDAGNANGVARYQAVLTHEGLVGRVKETGHGSAQVIAITDINSRIPVIAETSRDKAILAGDNSALPVLRYLPEETGIHVGERIITASDGGIFPAGLVVGEVSKIDGNTIRIQPYVNFDRLEYVRVVAATAN